MSELESLDARGLLCPLPVIRTQERVRRLPAGATLEVEATDAGTLEDIPAWCRVHGHRLLSSESEEKETGGGLVYRFRIQVRGD
jgi:TusA-related sulfurtransferase